MSELPISKLGHTWIFDLDGTLVVHNGYKNGSDHLLPGVREFFASIPSDDYVLLLTSRDEELREQTLDFLEEMHIRYNQIIFGVPFGERILINDIKPRGLKTAVAINVERDEGLSIDLVETEE